MNQRQKNQLNEIQKNIDDLIENYDKVRVFAKVIKFQYDLDYMMLKPFKVEHKIDEFINTYQKKVSDLYELVK